MGRSPQPPEPRSRDQAPIERSADAEAPDPPDAGTADYVDGVPTFDFVRDRIEGRFATATGSTELADDTAAARSLAQRQEDRDAAARERLEQIRRSMSGE